MSNLIQFRTRNPLYMATIVLGLGVAQAHEGHGSAPGQQPAAQETTAVKTAPAPAWLAGSPKPLSAQYEVTYRPKSGTAVPAASTWFFERTPSKVTVTKGNLQESWWRDAQGRISFERTFHREQRRIHYTHGELLALNVMPWWPALVTLMDARDVAALHPSGGPSNGLWQLEGEMTDGGQLRVTWDADRQLPVQIRRESSRGVLTLALSRTELDVPASWMPAQPSAVDYQLIDAADLGDMEQDPFARMAEHLDMRNGWRSAHKH